MNQKYSNHAISLRICVLSLLAYCDGSSTPHEGVSLVTVFNYDFWGVNAGRTWQTADADTVMYYDSETSVLQHYYADQVSMNEHHHATLKAFNSEWNTKVSAIVSSNEFSFQYGEVEWKARMPSVENLVTVFRVGSWNWEPKPDDESKFTFMEQNDPGIELRFQSDPKLSARAVLFSRNSPDFSGDALSFWVRNNPCAAPTTDVVQTITLKWTETRLEWLLNGCFLYTMDHSELIPDRKLYLAVYLVAGENFEVNAGSDVEPGTVSAVIQSVIVRQNQSVPSAISRPLWSNLIEEGFDKEGYLDPEKWRTYDGLMTKSGNLVEATAAAYVNDFVRVRGGYLQIMAGKIYNQMDLTEFGYGRVDLIAESAFLYGDVTWRMRVNYLKGLRYWLELAEQECSLDGLGKLCKISEGDSINFFDDNKSVLG